MREVSKLLMKLNWLWGAQGGSWYMKVDWLFNIYLNFPYHMVKKERGRIGNSFHNQLGGSISLKLSWAPTQAPVHPAFQSPWSPFTWAGTVLHSFLLHLHHPLQPYRITFFHLLIQSGAWSAPSDQVPLPREQRVWPEQCGFPPVFRANHCQPLRSRDTPVTGEVGGMLKVGMWPLRAARQSQDWVAAEKLQKRVLAKMSPPKSSKTQRQEDGCPPRQPWSAWDLVQTKEFQPQRHNLMPRVNTPPTSHPNPVLHTIGHRDQNSRSQTHREKMTRDGTPKPLLDRPPTVPLQLGFSVNLFHQPLLFSWPVSGQRCELYCMKQWPTDA